MPIVIVNGEEVLLEEDVFEETVENWKKRGVELQKFDKVYSSVGMSDSSRIKTIYT